MTESMVLGLLTLIGTMVTAYAGLKKYSSLTEYKLNELTKRVDKHNNFIERLTKAEKKVEVLCERIQVANHRIDDLEDLQK